LACISQAGFHFSSQFVLFGRTLSNYLGLNVENLIFYSVCHRIELFFTDRKQCRWLKYFYYSGGYFFIINMAIFFVFGMMVAYLVGK